ncbi:MAG: enoyl-CoA hydratase [Betaproteobacteria bacterium]|nr:enoyl-CoA hydratase [Betaproteobacteria bacterium]
MDIRVPAAVQQARLQPAVCSTNAAVEFEFSPQLTARFDKTTRSLWSRWSAHPRPCFSPPLLAELRGYCDFVAQSGGTVTCDAEVMPIEYTVLASDTPGIFNLGGDLDLFKQLIAAQDRQGLLRYGRACIDVLYRNYIGHELPLSSISLVQGECLGGGFEAALSSDIIIAEKSARFGFPEVLFNLFPGMGAYSFLDRKIGRKLTEDIISSGRIYSADEMLALGVVDVVTEDGAGDQGVHDLIKQRSRSRNGLAALAAVRRRVHSITFEELMDVVQIWVDAALRLNVRDLKLMQRLVSRQNGLGAPAQSAHIH